jgi:hypothetical protein
VAYLFSRLGAPSRRLPSVWAAVYLCSPGAPTNGAAKWIPPAPKSPVAARPSS